jgi:hypothetical protein
MVEDGVDFCFCDGGREGAKVQVVKPLLLREPGTQGCPFTVYEAKSGGHSPGVKGDA